MKWFLFFSICLLLQSCRFGKAVEEHRITDTGQSDLLRWVGSPFATVDLDEAEERPYGDFVDSIRSGFEKNSGRAGYGFQSDFDIYEV